jgi:hypothetical protein
MPFGLKTAPRVFTKILRPVAAWLRENCQTRLTIYMDDILILAASRQETDRQTKLVQTLLESLGWTLSYDKCRLTPAHSIEFLGWDLNFMTEQVRMTRKRRATLLQKLHSFLMMAKGRQLVECRKLASLLGELNFLRTQFPTASLYMGALNTTKTMGVRRSGWTGSTRLTPLLSGELKWWLRTVSHNLPHNWVTPQTAGTVTTDASPWGWGATLVQGSSEPRFAWGSWTQTQRRWSSNQKELTAILRATKVFLPSIPRGSTLELRSDNTAAVFSLRRWRGTQTRVPVLREIANLLRRHHCSMRASYIPGAGNGTADTLSRMGDSAEYYVTTASLMRACTGLGQLELTLDAFASQETRHLQRYCTLDRHDKSAWAVDGLTVDWSAEAMLLHPPPTLIPQTLTKIESENPQGILLVPSWKGQSWSPKLKEMSMTSIDLGSYQTAAQRTKEMMDRGWLLPPGNLIAYGLATRMTKVRSSLTSSPMPGASH